VGISYARKAEGVAAICGPYGELFEIKTISCGHCNRIIHVSTSGDGTGEISMPDGVECAIVPRKREPPAVCHQCWSLVCPQCHVDGRCTPLLKKIEEFESRRRLFEAVGI
jgi:hypothetical protein